MCLPTRRPSVVPLVLRGEVVVVAVAVIALALPLPLRLALALPEVWVLEAQWRMPRKRQAHPRHRVLPVERAAWAGLALALPRWVAQLRVRGLVVAV